MKPLNGHGKEKKGEDGMKKHLAILLLSLADFLCSLW